MTLQLVLLAREVYCKMTLISNLWNDALALLVMKALAIVYFLNAAATWHTDRFPPLLLQTLALPTAQQFQRPLSPL